MTIPEHLPDPDGHLARARAVFAARRAGRACPLPGDPVTGPAGRHGAALRGTILHLTLTLALDRPARARILCSDGIARCVDLTLGDHS